MKREDYVLINTSGMVLKQVIGLTSSQAEQMQDLINIVNGQHVTYGKATVLIKSSDLNRVFNFEKGGD